MPKERNFIKHLIEEYEQDLLGNSYIFELSDGEKLTFSIEPKDIPHLLGVRKLPIRQVYGKRAQTVYDMLKDGRINISHIEPYKEAYKKATNFHHLVAILHCGETVKIVKRVGRLNSSYFFYLDHSPEWIVHLGIVKDEMEGTWHPESLLINQKRNVTAYVDGQEPVTILKMTVTNQTEEDAENEITIETC